MDCERDLSQIGLGVNMKTAIIVTILMYFASANLFADATETGKVTQLRVNSNAGKHFVSIWLDGLNDNTDCSGGKRWTINQATDPLFKEKYSLILAAASAGKPITLFQNTGCATWYSNKVSQVSVHY